MSTFTSTDFEICELPDNLKLLVEVAGLPAAIDLAQRLGGSEYTFPVRYNPESSLVAVVGEEAAEKLIAYFSGEKYYIPKGDRALRCARNREIEYKYENGQTGRDLAQEYRLTERQVRSILNRPAANSSPTQLSLEFD